MSPEKGIMHHDTMIDEARVISNKLADVQRKVEQTTGNTENALLKNIRIDLGYDPVLTPDTSSLVDTRIEDKTVVLTPNAIADVLPVSDESAKTTQQSREAIKDILVGDDGRLIVITGPCSWHDPEAAIEYAKKVKQWRETYGEDLEILNRGYTEKPRTEKDWKGLIYDPKLDGTDDINLGVVLTRMLSCQITDMGVPIATERLNALTPQYVNGLVAYDAIGARNTTDQKAREYASGTSSPVGIKNTTDGSTKHAIDAIKSANAPHTFLGMSTSGSPMQVRTSGNELAHIILRGGDDGPNYSSEHVQKTKQDLADRDVLEAIVIDASHGNSQKDADRQIEVVKDVAEQISLGETAIKGVMIESNLVAGKQKLVITGDPIVDAESREKLEYGKSITDACVDLNQTEEMLEMLAEAVRNRRTVVRENNEGEWNARNFMF